MVDSVYVDDECMKANRITEKETQSPGHQYIVYPKSAGVVVVSDVAARSGLSMNTLSLCRNVVVTRTWRLYSCLKDC